MNIKNVIDNIHRILGFMSCHLKSVTQQYSKTPRNVNIGIKCIHTINDAN